MAGDVTVGTIKVEITGDAKPLEDAAKRGSIALKSLGTALADSNKGLSSLGVAAGTTAGILSADFITTVIKAIDYVASFAHNVTLAASKSVESMDFIAQATGLTLQQLQMLEPVFARNGMAAEQMGMVFRILATKMQEAKDTTSQAGQAFNELGLSLTGLESPSEVFSLIAERISRLPDGFQKTRLETELLGRSGARMSAVLNEGADGLKRSGEEALKMGNILNTQANTALLKVNDSFDTLTVAQGNLGKHLALFFTPFVQSANEAQLAMTNWGVKIVDEMTIASRVLAVRFQALWGFIKAQAELNLSDIGKIPELFTRWDDWAKEQIDNIRRLGVTAKDAGEHGVGVIDEKAQAAARSAAKMTEQFFFGLTQVDLGWKIVQESITAYGRSQEQLGKYITGQLIRAYDELRSVSELWSKSDFEGTKRSIDQYVAMEAALRGISEAGNQAALAGGRISPVQFAERSSLLAMQAVDQEIEAQQKLREAIEARYAVSLKLASDDAQKQRELIQQNLAEVAVVNDKIAVVHANRSARGIANAAAEEQAWRQSEQIRLQAATSIASSELQLAQASYADYAILRALRTQEIEAAAQQELAVAGLTQEQITAIHRREAAARAGIVQQFPTAFESAMQDIIGSSTFSMGTIRAQFSSTIADWMMGLNTFQQFFRNAMRSILQAFVDQLLKQMAIAALASGMGQMFSGLRFAFASATADPTMYGPGFAHGGRFTVPGAGGTDTTPVQFMATPGEEVSIRTPRQQAMNTEGSDISIVVNNYSKAEVSAQDGGTGTDGKRLIYLTVRDLVRGMVQGGDLDRQFGGRFGLSPQPGGR